MSTNEASFQRYSVTCSIPLPPDSAIYAEAPGFSQFQVTCLGPISPDYAAATIFESLRLPDRMLCFFIAPVDRARLDTIVRSVPDLSVCGSNIVASATIDSTKSFLQKFDSESLCTFYPRISLIGEIQSLMPSLPTSNWNFIASPYSRRFLIDSYTDNYLVGFFARNHSSVEFFGSAEDVFGALARIKSLITTKTQFR